MNRDEVTELDEGRGKKLIGTELQVVTPRPSSLLKDQGRGGRAYLPRPGRGRDEVGTRGRGSSETRPGEPVRGEASDESDGSCTVHYSPSDDWRSRAACRGLHTIFDPANEGELRASVAARHERAIQVCGRCPVLADCQQFARSTPRRFRQGVLGGHVYQHSTSKDDTK